MDWSGTEASLQVIVRVLVLVEFEFSGLQQVRLVANCEFKDRDAGSIEQPLN